MARPRSPVIDGRKVCSGCGQNLLLSEYHNRTTKTTCRCKSCANAYTRKLAQRPNQRLANIARSKKYREENKELMVEVSKQNWKKRKQRKQHDVIYKNNLADSKYWSSIKARYGITKDEYIAMLSKQENKCKICGIDNGVNKRLAVDHCHATGKIRGLLCVACNLGLGYFRDNPEALRSAALYLSEKEETTDETKQ